MESDILTLAPKLYHGYANRKCTVTNNSVPVYFFFSLFAHKINLLVFFFYFAELTKNKVEEIHKKTGGGLPPNPPSMSEETQIASF